MLNFIDIYWVILEILRYTNTYIHTYFLKTRDSPFKQVFDEIGDFTFTKLSLERNKNIEYKIRTSQRGPTVVTLIQGHNWT